jgi:general secretion pathway protein G
MNQGSEVIAMKSRRYNQEGFTLIEIMVVIAIIGLLALMIVPRFRGVTNQAKTTKAQADIAALQQQLDRYY